MTRFKQIILIFFIALNIFPQRLNQEFRGVWVASVANLDWPKNPGAPVEEQRKSLDSLFEYLADLNFNAIIFQVRPESDALYKSDIEPWSYWLTGKQGKAPDENFDPLKYAVKKAHSLGMELHAWLNPYRAVRKIGLYEISPKHVSIKHPDWIIQIGDFKFLNPALAEVRNYVTDIVEYIVSRYDIDGIHLDDYFYPYTPNEISREDSVNFLTDPRGFDSISDWRRDNVNLLISAIYKKIKEIKPFVRFGVSPFGIYKNNAPEGISGYSGYDKIYCDPLAWVKNKSVDYLSPQLYWKRSGPQDFTKLLKWWSEKSNGVSVIPGLSVYKIKMKDWDAEELPGQVNLSRDVEGVGGTIVFRAGSLPGNPKGFSDSLKFSLYKEKTIPVNFYSNVYPSAPKYSYYSVKNDSVIEIHNLSNYTGKFAVFNSAGKIAVVSYSSTIQIKAAELGNKFSLKNISRFDAVNGNGAGFNLTAKTKEITMIYPADGSEVNSEFNATFNVPNNLIRFIIVETSSDSSFAKDFGIQLIDYSSGSQKVKIDKKEKFFMRLFPIDENGKLHEVKSVELIPK